MPLVLIAVAISMILGLAFLATASTASATAATAPSRLNARMIAESGIGIALAHINSDPAWRLTRTNGNWVVSQPLAGGTLSIDVHDGSAVDGSGAVIGDGSLSDDTQDPVVITAIGTYRGTRHRVRAVRRVPAPTGIAVVERVSLRRNAYVDSYDPALPYDPATANARAIASSNGISRQAYIMLRKRSTVNGNVYYGPGGSMIKSVRMDGTATVTGTIGPLPSGVPRLDVVEPPWPGASVGDRHYSSGITTLTSDMWCDKLTVRGSAILRVIGNVKLRVDEEMLVADDARIQLGAPLAYAGATKGAIEVLDSAVIDSFDSSIGPYGGTNIGSDAALATNATAAGSIMLQLATVRGNLFTGVGSDPKTAIVKVGGTLTGKPAALATPLTIPSPPAWPTNTGTNVGNYDLSLGTTVIAANLHCDRFRATADAIVQISGHLVIRANREFVLDEFARLEILPDSSLTIYVGDSIKIAANAQANVNTGQASKLVFYSMGTGFVHTIDGDASAYAIIDAPSSSLVISGNGRLYGAFMGNTLSVKNFGQLHVDRNPAVATACPRLPVTFTTGNKLTLYTHESLTIEDNARFNVDAPNPLNVQINHLAGEPLRVRENAVGYAETYLRENTLDISGLARWTGRIRTRDLIVSGSAIVTADASGGESDPAITVEETVELQDTCVLNAAPGTGTALLASHGATDTTIRLEHYSVFRGDGFTTPGGSPNDEIRIASTATYTGIKSALDVPVDITAPPSPPMVGTPPDRNYTGSSTVVLSGDVYGKNFHARDDVTIEISGTTRIILSGDFRFSKRAKLTLQPHARLTIFCPGWVLFQDDVQVNLGGNPTRLNVVCGGTNYRILVMVGNARVCGTIIAPGADLLMWDRAEFFGAYRGKRLTMDKDSKMHCSEDGPVPITWLEQQ